MSPYIIEIKEGDKTIGIIPLYCSIISLNSRIKAHGSELSDYLLPGLSKKYSPDVLLRLAFRKIYEDKSSWDYIDWGDLPEESFLAHFLNSQLKRSGLIRKKQLFARIYPLMEILRT